MGEESLGFTKLLLSADSSQLRRGLEDARAHARETGKTLTQVAEEIGGKGRQVLRDHARIERAIIDLTGTETERQIAAVEDRYGRLLGKQRVYSDDTLKLQAALNTERRRILVENASDELKASNVVMHSRKEVARATVDAGRDVDAAGVRLKDFKDLTKVAGAELGRLGAGFSLMASAVSPATLALGAVAGGLMAYAKSLQEARQANDDFLKSASSMRQGLREAAIEHAGAGGPRSEVDLKKLQARYDEQARIVEEGRRKVAEMESKGLVKFARALGDLTASSDEALGETGDGIITHFLTKEAEATTLEVRKQQEELKKIGDELANQKKAMQEMSPERKRALEDLIAQNKLKRHALDQDELTQGYLRSRLEIEQRYRDLLREVTVEKERQALLGQKNLELSILDEQTARARRARAAELTLEVKEEAKARIEMGRERIRAERLLRDEAAGLEREVLKENVRTSGGAQEERLALLEAEQKAELQKFDEHYTGLAVQAMEAGQNITELSKQFSARRLQIVAQHEVDTKALLEETADTTVHYAEVAGEAFEKVALKVGRVRTSLLDLSAAQLELLGLFRKTDMRMTVNDGRGLNSGLSDFEKMKRGMIIDPFAGAFITPGPLMFGPSHGTSGGVRVNITNNGQPIGVSSATARFGPDGIDIDLIVAEAIRRSGSETEQAIADTFDVRRGGR